ncbi:MAG: SRPBCC domain-containing protein [Sporichthyaceae bacterium]|nr:SRPBCC domain-containing protein [Sporichthyaceae bacterium]
MARIVFETVINAPAAPIVKALDSADGIGGWWTDDVEFAGGVGAHMALGFPVAPLPFDLRVDEVSEQQVTWASVGQFPPHWIGTTIHWTLTAAPGGTTVRFVHDGWAGDDGPFGSSALTWGQLMGTLKAYVETGERQPLFRKG